MMLGHDHVIFLAAEPDGLNAAANRFAAAGFTVTERADADRETSPTRQKLICFEDGSYIEILSVRTEEARARHRFSRFLGLEDGWADYCLWTDDLAPFQERLRSAAMPHKGPIAHARALDDGRNWGVELILPGLGAGHPSLPFLLRDTANRELRIPRHGIRHANKAVGTSGVTVAVRDLDTARPLFRNLFATSRMKDCARADAVRGFRVEFGRQWIDVLEPHPDGPLADHLELRGESVAEVTLERRDGRSWNLSLPGGEFPVKP